jgi:DNA polymerase-3 subunit alpha
MLNKKCREMDMPAVAITDHGNMYGAVDFYNKLTQRKTPPEKYIIGNDLKPIIGCEFYVAEDLSIKTGGMQDLNHLVLLAKNMTGYKNLLKLNSVAFTEGFYYKPRIDMKLLREHSGGLVCLSACLAGYIPQRLLENDYEGAKAYAMELRDLFGEEDFYIELQDHGIEEQKRTNPLLYKIAGEIGVKVVATNDVHYINREDSEMQDVLMCVQMGKTIDAENRLKFQTDQFYLKSGDEMAELFSWCPEAVDNTLEIAEKCNVDIKFKQPLLPPYKPKDGSSPEEYLRALTEKGLVKRYGEITPGIRERAEYELNIIISMGFTEYYLIVWDFINYAKTNDIPVGAGRGSGVGSIVAYAVEITNVDPLKYNLLFERFLNPERVSNPDFDIDFCYEGRGEVIDYVIDKYGSDKVAQIITFGTMAAKAAIKDVGRVYNMPLKDVDRITKLIPFTKAHLKAIIGQDPNNQNERIPEIMELYNNEPMVQKIMDMAIKLEGMPRNCSTHAAGVVICRDPVSDHVPLQRNGEDITTQYDKDQIEDIGLLKMDFLGLRTLTDIKYAYQYVKENTGFDVDFEKLGYEDPAVYKLIGEGKTGAVFQLESGGMKDFMRKLKPENFEDIIAGIAMYRPGPMDAIPRFCSNKANPNNIVYDHPLLKPILDVTYGCIIYQEQVMQIVRELGGYSYGRADIMRRAMSKKKLEELLREKKSFVHGCPADKNSPAVDGAVKRGVPEDVAEKIFAGMESFASYAFNKSHAAAYAVLSYETAYYMNYYPAEFLTSVINNRITNIKEVSHYVMMAENMDIKVLQPDVNESAVKFKCTSKEIRFGLSAIKNVGESAIEKVISERNKRGPFKSLYDFIDRVDSAAINKRMLECMILSGAFDCFKETRATLMASYEEILGSVVEDKRMRESGQMSLFDMAGSGIKKECKLHYIAEYPTRDKLIKEKEVVGVYITGHPLEEYKRLYDYLSFNTSMIELSDTVEGEEEGESSSLDEWDGKQVETGGLITAFRRQITKSGMEMGICTIEDLYGTIDVVFYSGALGKFKDLLVPDTVIKVKGKVSVRRGVSIIADNVSLWEIQSAPKDRLLSSDKKLCLRLLSENDYNEIKDILAAYPGSVPVRIQMNNHVLDPKLNVNPVSALMFELLNAIGEENIRIIDSKSKKQ